MSGGKKTTKKRTWEIEGTSWNLWKRHGKWQAFSE